MMPLNLTKAFVLRLGVPVRLANYEHLLYVYFESRYRKNLFILLLYSPVDTLCKVSGNSDFTDFTDLGES